MSDDVHVYPLGDLAAHILDGGECSCAPRVETVAGGRVIVQRAWDQRDLEEIPPARKGRTRHPQRDD